jgi:hypothetical protein
MKRPIGFKLRRFIHQQVLVPLFCFHHLKIWPKVCFSGMDEDAATRLPGQIVQCLIPVGTA